MTYTLELSAAELETLKSALNEAYISYHARASNQDLRDSIIRVNKQFRDESGALWSRVYRAQKAADEAMTEAA